MFPSTPLTLTHLFAVGRDAIRRPLPPIVVTAAKCRFCAMSLMRGPSQSAVPAAFICNEIAMRKPRWRRAL